MVEEFFVEGLTGLLEAIESWGSALWMTIGEPAETLGSYAWDFAKATTGPTLAFVLARRASERDQKQQDEKEADAVRTLLMSEIHHNIEEMQTLSEGLKRWIGDRSAPSINTCLSKSIMQKTAMDSLIADIPLAISDGGKIREVYKFYRVVDVVIQNKELYQDKPVPPVTVNVMEMDIRRDPVDMARERQKRQRLIEEEEERRGFLTLLEETVKKGNPLA
ncbi:hypothetical protein [Leptolyngbya iicbica]|uniref:Uncharacterized protein n=2 Tax=Cyanophyceae TaxID=3028117 RepID=A0A4Q7EKG7_9CYAN|nr:hypothetical protein [Leptolyngbya sp. LK]RZM82299.1 hypothetical protein DYY88_03355 [Leptolyngbya sp. LK]